MDNSIPRQLYHYTSVDVLELILKNQTIRFNSLNRMDDPEEQWSVHGNQEGKHVFVSCWTDRYEEIPEMWKQYCKKGLDSGVRISLPSNPFSLKRNILPGGMKEVVSEMFSVNRQFIYETLHIYPASYDEEQSMMQEALRMRPNMKKVLRDIYEDITHKHVECHSPSVDNILHKVEYTTDQSKLFPGMYFDYNGIHFETYSDFGKFKNPSWSWQFEWRYILHFRMVSPGIRRNDGTIELYDLPFNYYDLYLDENKLNQMKITMSPLISKDSSKRIVELVEKYNPMAQIYSSKLATL